MVKNVFMILFDLHTKIAHERYFLKYLSGEGKPILGKRGGFTDKNGPKLKGVR
jgi:hypothetical protein